MADVVVVGAGVMGAWTAFYLRLRGAKTLLVDAWEPGHVRASSSGESRVIRAGYGERRLYTRWAWGALGAWKQWEQAWGVQLFHRLGVLWLHERESDYTAASLAALEAEKIPVERIAPEDLPKRFPQISPQGIGVAYLEPEGGALLAERSVRAVGEAFVGAGGEFRLGRVESPRETPAGRPSTPRLSLGVVSDSRTTPLRAGRCHLEEVRLADGSKLEADSFVFACGPWLPELFPIELGNFIRVTRQEVFFFGVPPGDPRFSAGPEASGLPVWLSGSFYGVPALAGRGFKIAEDELGPPFDPTTGERMASEEGLARVRQFLAQRFPGMKYAPLMEARVCQYESTRDGHLLIDRHPEWENVWLVGGGSGHGFKLGPKVGELVAAQVTGRPMTPIPEEFRLRPRPATPTRSPTSTG